MSYTTGPYARFTTLPVPDRPVVNSARNIDFATLRYTLDGSTGGFDRMPPVAQQVMLLILGKVKEPKFNTEQSRNEMVLAIEAALAPLTKAPNPTIKLVEVSIERDAAGSSRRLVTFTDLTKNTGNDVQVQV